MIVVCKCGHRFAETLGRIGPTYGLTWLDLEKGSKTFRQKVKVCPGCGVELSRADLQSVKRKAGENTGVTGEGHEEDAK